MQWVRHFHVFLFDFDGLLVNTEEVHYAAFMQMLAERNCVPNWDFKEYCRLAHTSGSGLQDATYAAFPELYNKEPNWEVLRAEKAWIYLERIRAGQIELMPGVEHLLKSVQEKGIKRCVATNSTAEQVALIQAQLPILKTIPLWITREDYTLPKPHPEPYLKALERLQTREDRIVGFEDTLKGLKALQGTPAKAVLIAPQGDFPQGTTHFSSFEEIPDNWGERKDNGYS